MRKTEKPEGVRETLWNDWKSWLQMMKSAQKTYGKTQITWGVMLILEGESYWVKHRNSTKEFTLWRSLPLPPSAIFHEVEICTKNDVFEINGIDLFQLQQEVDNIVAERIMEE